MRWTLRRKRTIRRRRPEAGRQKKEDALGPVRKAFAVDPFAFYQDLAGDSRDAHVVVIDERDKDENGNASDLLRVLVNPGIDGTIENRERGEADIVRNP